MSKHLETGNVVDRRGFLTIAALTAATGCARQGVESDSDVVELKEEIASLRAQIEKIDQGSVGQTTDLEALRPFVRALQEGKIVIQEDSTFEAAKMVAAQQIIGNPQQLAVATVPGGHIFLNNGEQRLIIGQDQRDYDGDGKMDIGIAEIVFRSPKISPLTGKAMVDPATKRPVMENSLEFEDHVTWRGIKIFDLGKAVGAAGPGKLMTDTERKANSPMLEAIMLDEGHKSPANMPYLKPGYLNLLVRAKDHPVIVSFVDSTKGADNQQVQLILDGRNNRFVTGDKVLKLNTITQ